MLLDDRDGDLHVIGDVLVAEALEVLIGAPSRSANGKHYNYSKCKYTGHNNINDEKAQMQFKEALKYMRLPA